MSLDRSIEKLYLVKVFDSIIICRENPFLEKVPHPNTQKEVGSPLPITLQVPYNDTL